MRLFLSLAALALLFFSCNSNISNQSSDNSELQDQQLLYLQRKLTLKEDSMQVLKEQLSFLRNKNVKKEPSILGDSILLARDSMMSVFVRQVFTASPTPHYPLRINLFDNSFDAFVVKVKKSKIRFFWSYPQSKQLYRNFKNVKQVTEQLYKKQLLFATNAGMFTPTSAPKGLYIENGKVIQPLDTISGRVGYLNFYLQPNGVFYLTKNGDANIVTTREYQLFSPSSVEYATQSGPMLVIDGKIHPAFNQGSPNKYIRSGVGLIDNDHIVFIISNRPVNFYDFATLFRDYFGCSDALYLDGAISEMYLPELKRDNLNGNFGPIIGIIE